MKKRYILLTFFTLLVANDAVHKFAKSAECKTCHTQIYNEYFASIHAKATPDKDVIHNAVWKKHPQNLKNNRYVCGTL